MQPSGNGGRVDGIDFEVFKFQQRIDDRSLGRFDGNAQRRIAGPFSPLLNDFGNGLGRMKKSSTVADSVWIDQMVVVFFIGPIDAD